jgi:hypothetical protein
MRQHSRKGWMKCSESKVDLAFSIVGCSSY